MGRAFLINSILRVSIALLALPLGLVLLLSRIHRLFLSMFKTSSVITGLRKAETQPVIPVRIGIEV